MTNSQKIKLQGILDFWKGEPSIKITHYLGDIDGKLYVRVVLPFGGADRYTIGKRGSMLRWSEK